VFKGAKDAGVAIDSEIAVALAVPVALLRVSLIVRRVRRHHRPDEV